MKTKPNGVGSARRYRTKRVIVVMVMAAASTTLPIDALVVKFRPPDSSSSSFSSSPEQALSSSPFPISPVHTLLLCRHGDSIWNGGCPGLDERFTGWTDVPLSETGRKEAAVAAKQLTYYFDDIDACFTSTLQRAQETTKYCLSALEERGKTLPTELIVDYRLNERHYGALQGYVKQDVEEGKYGHSKEEVTAWRRSWNIPPPPLTDEDPRRKAEVERFGAYMNVEDIPVGESLEMVAKRRIRPFVDQVLTPILNDLSLKKAMRQQRLLQHPQYDQPKSSTPLILPRSTGLIVAHANSLRALLGVLCEVEDDPIALEVLERLKLPTGVPLVLNYQQMSTGKYRALPLPEADECVVPMIDDNDDDDTIGEWLMHPMKPPEHMGHPNLPVWPLNRCIPIQDAEHLSSLSPDQQVLAVLPDDEELYFYDSSTNRIVPKQVLLQVQSGAPFTPAALYQEQNARLRGGRFS